MIRFFLGMIALISLLTLGIWNIAGAEPTVPKFSEMSGPPQMVENKDGTWSVVLSFGDVLFKYRITKKEPKPMPQCNIVTQIGNELQIIQARPMGMVVFSQGFPYEFMTKHNNEWLPIVPPTYIPGK